MHDCFSVSRRFSAFGSTHQRLIFVLLWRLNWSLWRLIGFYGKKIQSSGWKKNLLRLFIWHPLPISSFLAVIEKNWHFLKCGFFSFLAIFLAPLCHFYYHLLIPLKIVKFEISLCIQTCQLNTIQHYNTKTVFRQKYPNMTVLDAWIKVDSRSALGEQK